MSCGILRNTEYFSLKFRLLLLWQLWWRRAAWSRLAQRDRQRRPLAVAASASTSVSARESTRSRSRSCSARRQAPGAPRSCSRPTTASGDLYVIGTILPGTAEEEMAGRRTELAPGERDERCACRDASGGGMIGGGWDARCSWHCSGRHRSRLMSNGCRTLAYRCDAHRTAGTMRAMRLPLHARVRLSRQVER